MAKMYCQKCGCELKEGEMKCPECGTSADDLIEMNEYVQEKKPKKKHLFPFVIVIVVIALAFSFFMGGDRGKYRSSLYDACIILDQAEDIEKDMTLMLDTWKDKDKDAVTELYQKEDFKKRIDIVRSNQEKLLSLREGLSDPPKELKNFKEPMEESIDRYIEYSNVLLNPEGSYDSVKEEAGEKSKSFFDAYTQFIAIVKADNIEEEDE